MMKRFVLTVTAVLAMAAGSAMAGWHDQGAQWARSGFVGAGAGYQQPQRGFPGYRDSYAAGLDVYFMPGRKSYRLPWWNHMITRVSIDYMPMILPKGTNDTTEDVTALAVDFLYPFYSNERYNFFAGLGAGAYWDIITADTHVPGVGTKSATSVHAGFRPSIGVGIKVSDNIELLPEIRTNFFYNGGDLFILSTYRVSAALKFW